MKKLLYTAFLSILGTCSALAQSIQATLTLVPPHSPYLENYGSPSANSLMLTLIALDLPENTIDLSLKMEVTGPISFNTSPNFQPSNPIVLTNGVPLILSGFDLRELFDPNNNDFLNVTRQEFINNGGILDEGFYNFCIQAFEPNSNYSIPISNETCDFAYIELFDPPVILNPLGNQTPLTPQSMMFNWQPQHIGNFMTNYTLEIWKNLEGMSYQQIIENEVPLFVAAEIYSTSFFYGPSEPVLDPGSSYITRVRAVAENSGQVFKNNGYSDIEPFSYGTDCPEPINVKMDVNGIFLTLDWDAPLGDAVLSYSIKYRGVGNAPNNWVTGILIENATSYTFQTLERNKSYEIEIRSNCIWGKSIWVNLGTKQIVEEGAYNCGQGPGAYPQGGNNPLAVLKRDEKFNAGDFEVVVTSASGGNGSFFGQGYVHVPFLNRARVNVRYNGITINEERFMTQGEVIVTGVGLQLISDDLANMLNDILDAINTVEDLLNAGLAILETLDDIIALVEPFLPDEIMQNLINAQQALQQAMAMANDPNVSPEEAQVALQQAQEQLEAANQAFQEALLEFMGEFKDIIIAAIGQLYNEYQGQKAQIQSNYTSEKTDLHNWLEGVNAPFSLPSGGGGNAVIVDGGSGVSNENVSNDPNYNTFVQKATTYFQKEVPYSLVLVIEKLKTDVVDIENAKQFAALLAEYGFQLLQGIGQKIKDQEPENQIIDYAKTEIVAGLTKIIIKI